MNRFSRPEGQLGQGDTIARPLKQVGPEESCMRKVTKMRKVLMNHRDLGGFYLKMVLNAILKWEVIRSDRTYHIWIVWLEEFCLTHPEIHLVAGACPAGRSCSEHYQRCISQLWVVAHRRGTKGEVLCEKGILPTPWKINMEPENDSLEDDFTFQLGDFRFHVNLPGCKFARPTKRNGIRWILKWIE